MRKIFLSAGHGGKDPGASANGYIERDLAIEFRKLIASHLSILGVTPIMDDDKNILSETLHWLRGKFTQKDILFDIHWNAGGGTGTECIVPDVSTPFERQLAGAIVQVVNDVTGLTKRRKTGVLKESETPRKKLGWMRPSAENVLLETCFIDSKSDMAVYQASKGDLAKRIAKVLYDFSKI